MLGGVIQCISGCLFVAVLVVQCVFWSWSAQPARLG
jgi:hypothetical protein